MGIAAPKYVLENHSLDACPPGHRFSLYFDGWNGDWKIADGGKAEGLRRLLKLGDGHALLAGLRERQLALAESITVERRMIVDAVSTSPFATGLGIEHSIENGFAFLAPYGLPYLAASGLKGVLRRSAEELVQEGDMALTQPLIDTLFGPEDPASSDRGVPLADDKRRRGALTLWDVFPAPARDQLVVEIMTPHYEDYYQGKSSPHDAGQPIPIPFLAIPAGSAFRFIVTLEPAFMPEAVADVDWKSVISKVFAHAFAWLGFGAKTAVGYGAMEIDKNAQRESAERQRLREADLQRRRQETERKRAIEAMPPVDRAIQAFLDARPDKKQPEVSALIGGMRQGAFDQVGKVAVAERIRDRMLANKQWREESNARKPEKDWDYQDTLRVKAWIEGK